MYSAFSTILAKFVIANPVVRFMLMIVITKTKKIKWIAVYAWYAVFPSNISRQLFFLFV